MTMPLVEPLITATAPETNPHQMRVLVSLRRIIHAIDAYSRRMATDHQITSPQLTCLAQIVQDGQATLSQLSRTLYLDPSTLIGIIDRLEAKGLVHRQRCTIDRRRVLIYPSKAGQSKVDQSPSQMQVSFAANFRRLSPKTQAEIARAMERVVELMGITTELPPGGAA